LIAVIFEVEPKEGRAQDYFDIAMGLKSELEKIDGFISVERFESTATPGRFFVRAEARPPLPNPPPQGGRG